MQPLRVGATGPEVAEVRGILVRLGLLPDGPSAEATQDHSTYDHSTYDHATELAVRTFQQTRGLRVDGIVGDETQRTLRAARWPNLGDRVLSHNGTTRMFGDDVAALQTRLLDLGYAIGRPDGVFGATTATGLRTFQRESGLRADGICGPATLQALQRLGRPIVGGRPQLMREWAAVRDSGPNLLGKRIVIDPAHGGDDTGATVEGQTGPGTTEAELTWDIAHRLEGRLVALGVNPWLTRGPRVGATDEARAEFANRQGADLLLSVHIDGGRTPDANGVACYYYGAGGNSSTIGERLADLIQRELVARTGLRDCRIHGKSWDILRLTSMPAVRIELGYLTSPVDRAKLLDPAFRNLAAEAILVGVQRLYLPQDADHPTGVYKLPLVV